MCPGEFKEGFLQKVVVKQALKAKIVRIRTGKLSLAETITYTKALRLKGLEKD